MGKLILAFNRGGTLYFSRENSLHKHNAVFHNSNNYGVE